MNGVPLKRVNQAYVVATSTSVDVSAVKADKFDDAYFSKPAAAKSSRKKGEEGFYAAEEERAPLPESVVADQKAVDAALAPAIEKVKDLKVK